MSKMCSIYCHLLHFSGASDHVFVNFVDHGAPGILAFPMSEVLLSGQYS